MTARKELYDNQKAINKMAIAHPYLSIIILKGQNSPIKGHRLAEWGGEDPSVCCLHRIHLSSKDTHRLNVKGWKKTMQANGN